MQEHSDLDATKKLAWGSGTIHMCLADYVIKMVTAESSLRAGKAADSNGFPSFYGIVDSVDVAITLIGRRGGKFFRQSVKGNTSQ
jgi:hypothetical protein